MNQVIWPKFYNIMYQIQPQETYAGNVAVLKSWISQRIAWLDAYLNSSKWVRTA